MFFTQVTELVYYHLRHDLMNRAHEYRPEHKQLVVWGERDKEFE